MKLYKTSPLTGQRNVMDLDVTEEQIDEWRGGKLIQDVMPHLSPGEREFLISGLTPGDWEKLYGKDDD